MNARVGVVRRLTSLFRAGVPWRIGVAEKTREQFETDTLPRYIESQRWYAAKGRSIERARITEHVLWEEGKACWLVAFVELDGSEEPASYILPLALAWEERDEERARNLSTAAVAKIRQQGNVGVMGDAFADELFCRSVVAAMAVDAKYPWPRKAAIQADGRVHGDCRQEFAALPVERPRGSSSNTIVNMRERLMLKGYRRQRVGH